MANNNIVLLSAAGEKLETEQVRMFLYEAGLKYDEVKVTDEVTQALVKDGKLLFENQSALQVGSFYLTESKYFFFIWFLMHLF